MGNLNDIFIDPVAYLKIIMHTKRFWNEKIPENKRQFIYGALIGYEEDNIRYITDYKPLFHSKYELDFEKKHSTFMKMDKINRQLVENQDPDFIIGWVKSSDKEELNLTPIDKKNQIYLQTAYHKKAVSVFVLIPTLEYDHGIEIRGYIDMISTINQDSIMADLYWDFDQFSDIDEIFKLVKELNALQGIKRPLIKEEGEIIIGLPK